MRKANIERNTNETKISLDINLDGTGKSNIKTPIAFLNHMLELFSFHTKFDLNINAEGDIDVDYHHTVEDIGICLGKCFKEALNDKKGINRYGFFILPMDEARTEVTLDISGRPYFTYEGKKLKGKTGTFDTELVEEFFNAFTTNSSITLHIKVKAGDNQHHIIESIFKAFARAIKIAASINKDDNQVPSTKGVLD